MVTSEKTALQVAKRNVLGKNVAKLRRNGVTPGNIFGKGQESIAIQVSSDDFRHFIHDHGRNEIVYVDVEGENRPTFIRNIQRNPITDQILHVDFLQVDLTQKVRLEVAIHLEGIPPALDLGGILTHALNSVDVEALPTNVPSALTLDVSVLTEMGQSIHVSALEAPEGVDILTDPETVIARIDIPAAEKSEAELAEEGEAAEGEEGEAAEGDEAAEEAEGGEKASEESAEE
ncbi:MAG TPA: 50S ribosomal protein L25 [Dehalococcoidia bacterium]|nr:50S ribosomal protein L25 [Dehalococcoidia bacterium]